jgi:pyruvate/2-oxoglutarate dehydrogenase complex dihydrolipoamide acyltransferase (E2) component
MSSSNTEAGTLIDVLMPQMGTSVVEGTVLRWQKGIGDAVEEGETVCEVSTDKVDVDCPAPVSGILAAIAVDVGETAAVGARLARIEVDQPGSAEEPRSPAEAERGSASTAVGRPSTTTDGECRPPQRCARPSPLAKRMAADLDIDLGDVEGTGRGGRVTKRDILAYQERHRGLSTVAAQRPLHGESPYRPDPPAPIVPGPGRESQAGTNDLGGSPQQLSRMRLAIGRAMSTSQNTAATCHTVVECDVTRLETARRRLGLTALPLVARATVRTLHEFPELNATLEGETITRFDRVHLGIAVSLGSEGLIVPVIHDAQDLSPEGLSVAIRDRAARARAKALSPGDVRGATFTITNPGAFGATIATPVIDLPQVGILDLEAIVRRPVVVAADDGTEAIAIRSMVNLILGWDHRALDGVYAAQFLGALRERLQSETA